MTNLEIAVMFTDNRRVISHGTIWCSLDTTLKKGPSIGMGSRHYVEDNKADGILQVGNS